MPTSDDHNGSAEAGLTPATEAPSFAAPFGEEAGMINPGQHAPDCDAPSDGCRDGQSSSAQRLDPLDDRMTPQRPGVSNHTLRQNEVKLDRVGGNAVLRIPYVVPQGGKLIRDGGSDFYRLRLISPAPGQPKYIQPKDTIPHAYFPFGAFDLINESGTLIITEGEFKAMSLVEAGQPAVGIGGINNFAHDGALVPELRYLQEQCTLRRVYFLGDADTCLIPQFADAAVKLRKLLAVKTPRVDFRLPRMAFADQHRIKGIDDARAAMRQSEFPAYFRGLQGEAVSVGPDVTADQLAWELLNHERRGFVQAAAQFAEKEKNAVLEKLVRLASFCGPRKGRMIADLAVEAQLAKTPSEFKAEQKRQLTRDRDMESETEPKKRPKMYYFPQGAKSYFYETHGGDFTRVDRRGATNFLVASGFCPGKRSDGLLTQVDSFLTDLESRPMEWVGPLAGRRAGMHMEGGRRILVTRSPQLLTPAPGPWPILRAFIEGVLGNVCGRGVSPSTSQGQAAVCQSEVFLSWLSLAVRDLYVAGGKFIPSQALVLAGPKRVGKNVLQQVITHCLGGRSESPFSYMEGRTTFNGNLVGAEHWMIADEQEDSRFAERQKLQSFLKQFCVNENIAIQAKFSETLALAPFRRVSMSLNDDKNSLRVLPALSENFADKLIILKVSRFPFFGDGTPFESFSAWWKAVELELPCMVHELIHEFRIPTHLQDPDYRVNSYHNREIVAALAQSAPEMDFAEVVGTYLFTESRRSWRGTARQLIDELRRSGCPAMHTMPQYAKPVTVGKMLADLTRNDPGCYREVGTVNGLTHYEICWRPDPPPDESH